MSAALMRIGLAENWLSLGTGLLASTGARGLLALMPAAW